MRLLAAAKINLHLRVAPPRSDGFHPLMSWFVTVGLFDTLTLDADPQSARPLARSIHAATGSPISLRTDQNDLPTDERNLVVRAAKALADTHKGSASDAHRREGVSAYLEKRIPMGAGIGGGSSDAARALLGLNDLWKLGRSPQQLSEFSAVFGSDLPFFFHGPSSICTGRGEKVKPIARPMPKFAVLVLPELHISTPAVYRRFDEMKLGHQATVNEEPDWNEWTRLEALQLLPLLVNDLEAPAFSLNRPLSELRDAVERLLKRPVRMSGSGSSLFSLFNENTEAKAAVQSLQSSLNVTAHHVELAPEVADDLKLFGNR
jgi:4-diphosphocytidyl-2-C-methyl-D-erythritol kinase